MKTYQAYLFDMDGTLVNSEPLKGLALSLACRDFGGDPGAEIYKAVMGEPWAVVTDYFFNQAGISPEPEAFTRRFRGYYENLLSEQLELNPGALAYLSHLKSRDKKCGIVSSAAAWMVHKILGSLKVGELFDLVIAREDVTRHKPHPQAYTLALERLCVGPDRALVFEDSAAGVEAAAGSGCEVVAFAHEFNSGHDFGKAVKVITGYGQMR